MGLKAKTKRELFRSKQNKSLSPKHRKSLANVLRKIRSEKPETIQQKLSGPKTRSRNLEISRKKAGGRDRLTGDIHKDFLPREFFKRPKP